MMHLQFKEKININGNCSHFEPPAHQNGLIWILLRKKVLQIFNDHVGVVIRLHEEIKVVYVLQICVDQSKTSLRPKCISSLGRYGLLKKREKKRQIAKKIEWFALFGLQGSKLSLEREPDSSLDW